MNKQADDTEVIATALSWLQSGHRVALATVTRTWGSSPRPPGSLLTMNDKKQFAGSLSGGCVEDSLVARYCDGELAGPAPTRLNFGIDRQETSRLGLPCGGRLEILVEHLSDPETTRQLLRRLENGELITRTVNLNSGAVSLQADNNNIEFKMSETELIKTFGPAWQLLLIGDGQLARHLASMARHLDYHVTICDPRDAFTHPAVLTDVHLSRAMPDDAVHDISDQARAAIVTLAHDPRQDDLALCAALETEAFYIGALGSKKSAQARCQRLASLGYSEEQLRRIHGPVGLDIGSKRPAEIAVSILAQITAIRNSIPQPAQQKA